MAKRQLYEKYVHLGGFVGMPTEKESRILDTERDYEVLKAELQRRGLPTQIFDR